MAQGDTIRTIIKFIDCEGCQERELAVSTLCELSKSELVCAKISELNGAILILGKVAGSKTYNPTMADKAEKTLDNLDRCERNAVQMAENGRLEPLLNLLIEGAISFLIWFTKHSMLSISVNKCDTNSANFTRFSREAAADGIIARKDCFI